MKKFIQNLFKNKIFKKITMSVLFVAMCFVACFMNWKAIAGDATPIGGGNSKIMTFTWDPNNDSIRSISFFFEHAEDGITINRNISDNTNATWSDGAISVDYNNQEYIWVYVITDKSKTEVNINHNGNILETYHSGITNVLFFKQLNDIFDTCYDYDPGIYSIVCGSSIGFEYENSNVNVADLMDIEYATSNNNTFGEFQQISTDANGKYERAFFDKVTTPIRIRCTGKAGCTISGLQYSQTSENVTSLTYSQWDDGTHNYREYQLRGRNTFMFRGVTTSFNIEEQNAEINSSLFNKLDIKYSYDSNNPNDSFPNNGALTPEVGKKMHISISPKTGYDVSELQYSIDGGTTYQPWSSNNNPFTNGSGFDILKPTTLKIKNVKYKQVKLHFVDENNQALDSDLVKIIYNGSTLSGNEQVVNGISTTSFRLILGDVCANESISIDDFVCDEGINKDSGSWNGSARSFDVTLTVNSSASDLNVKIKNLRWKTAKFTFTRDDREALYLTKKVGDTHYSEYTPWDQNNCLTVNDACRYKSNITFYLNAADFARWNSENYGLNDLIIVKDYDTSEDMQISASYQSDIDAYAITFTNVMRDVDVTLKSDVVSISDINVKFSGINLPQDRENHNGINITQGSVAATYPERISSEPYTFVAKITPKNPGESIIIQLSNTDNFEFIAATDAFDFYDSNNQKLGSVPLGENSTATVSFKIPDGTNDSKNILGHLEQGDLNVVCNCLKPKDKSLYFVLDSGISGIQVKDDRGNQITQKEDNNVDNPPYDAYYGAFITVTAKLNDGYFMEIPEDCVHIHKYNMPDAEITNWIITQDGDKDSSIYKIEFFDLLTDDIEIVFTCDQNSIPINFKNFEGADYYAVEAVNNGFELRDAIKGIITVKSGDDCYFAVGAQKGYDLNGLTITRNGTEVGIDLAGSISDDNDNEKYKVYKLENVKTNVTVNGSIPKRILTVKFKPTALVEGGDQGEETTVIYKRDNYAINGGVDVTYGNAVTFTVSLDDKYSQSNFKVLVKNENEANGREVTKYQNEYRITDITANQTVSVEGVTVNKYTLNFVPSSQAEFLVDGASFTGVKNANYDSSFEFKVRAKTGYKLGENLVVNCQKDSGDTELEKIKDSSDNGIDIYRFKIENIKENYTLVIDKVENITYKITLQHVEGATYLNDQNSVVSGDMKVNYGKNFEFSVTLADAYDDSAAGMYIIINDGKSKLSAQKLSSGRYMIPNITEDITIKVGNVRKNTYTITLQDEDGIDYYSADNKLITGDNTVEHKGSLSFKVNVYPSYSDSSITVMLGNDKMAADSSGYYHISGVIENKTVTVIGLHPNSEVGLVNAINNLPSPVNDLNDVDEIIEASKWYNSLNDAQKANITNADVLMKHQEEAGAVLHRSNDVTIDGPDWYIKLIVNPISSDMDACARIYKKLNSEYVLSLYDIYLWDTLNDVRYTPSGDQMYTITVPTPRLINFKNPTGVHENSNSGKISFMDLNFNGDTVSFETNSFSAMGIIAELDASGASSLFDAAGVNLDWVNDYVLGDAKSNSSNKNMSSGTITRNADASEDYTDGDQIVGNINDKFRSTNNRVTAQGSALRLILVLLVLILLALAIWVIYKRRKEEKEE